MLDTHTLASDNEEADAEADTRARCMESHNRAGYVGVHGIVQSAAAHSAKRSRAVGLAKRASSARKEHEELALAESYRDNRTLDKKIFRSFYRVHTASPPMASFRNNYKTGVGACVLSRR
jgi:hypothetical protein